MNIIKGDFKEAILEYNDIVKKFPYWNNIWYDVDDIRVELLFLKEAETLKRKEQILLSKAYREVILGNYNNAIDIFRNLSKSKSNSLKIFAQYSVGRFFYKMGKYKLAIKELKKALNICNNKKFKEMIEYYIIKCNYYLYKIEERQEKFKVDLENYLKKYPQSDRADECYYNISFFYKEKKDSLKAIKLLRNIVKYFPTSNHAPKAQFEIGYIYNYNIKDRKIAMEEFKKCFKKYPKTFHGKMAGYFIGHICFVENFPKRDFRKCEEFYMKLLSMYSNDIELYQAVKQDLQFIETNKKSKVRIKNRN